MIPPDQYVWRLSKGGDQSLGLCCTEEGLFLGRTPLLERRGGAFVVRPHGDLKRLLTSAYSGNRTLAGVLPGLATVASALSRNNLPLAQIAALHLRLPDLPDAITRLGLESEDLLLKHERDQGRLTRAWEEADHPRTGAPPNPGWFAPKDGPDERVTPAQSAQEGREEQEPEEILDPTAPVRQAVWNARMTLLRRIDPNNPNLTYFANPGSTPTVEQLRRLDAAIEAASVKRVTDKVMPNGLPIGRPGSSADIRELPGGTNAAKAVFDYLRVGGQVRRSESNLTVIQLPGKAGFLTFRHRSSSGDSAIDINVPGITVKRIHFP